MKTYWVLASAVLLTGCMVSNGLQYDAVSETNIYHLFRINKGMTEGEVIAIMGGPYMYEPYVVDNTYYDVWFYVTRPTVLDQTRMVPQNLTPLTFKNGILVGTGYVYYYHVYNLAMKEEIAQMEPHKKEDAQQVEICTPPPAPPPVTDQIDGYDREGERMEEEAAEQNFNFY